MKIQYASDLHLEFGANTIYLRNNPLRPVGDILILAGDIGYLGDEMYINHPFWDWASENYKRVVVIPGNHELYNYFDINELNDDWHFKVRPNIECVYNSVVALNDDTDLIATTLWSEIPVKDAFYTEKSVSDFYRIKNGDYKLSWERFNDEHNRCRKFLENSLNSLKAHNIIVATHHVPSFKLMSDEFIGSPINGAFTSELGNFIANSKIKYWIYGHSHRNINLKIGETQCVSNQLCYVSRGEHLSFRHDAIIEI